MNQWKPGIHSMARKTFQRWIRMISINYINNLFKMKYNLHFCYSVVVPWNLLSRVIEFSVALCPLTSLKVYVWKSGFILMPFFSPPELLIPGHSGGMGQDMGIKYCYQKHRIWPQTDWNPKFEHLLYNSSKLILVSLFGDKIRS